MEVLYDEAYKEIMLNNNLYGDQKNQEVEEEENTKEKGRNEGPENIEIDEESSSKGMAQTLAFVIGILWKILPCILLYYCCAKHRTEEERSRRRFRGAPRRNR